MQDVAPLDDYGSASFWAADQPVRVSRHTRGASPGAWTVFEQGLADAGRPTRASPSPGDQLWLLRARDGRPLGGASWVAPRREGIPALSGLARLHASPDFPDISCKLSDRVGADRLVEFTDLWLDSDIAELPGLLARCMLHALWWNDAQFGFCPASDPVEHVLRQAAAAPIHGVRPAEDTTLPYVLEAGRYAPGAAEESLLWFERHCLQASWDRAAGDTPLDQTWCPEIILEGDPRVAELERAGVRVVDHIAAMRSELDELLPPISADLRDEPPRWVHFPWRNTITHLPGPRAYRRMRTDRNRHKLLDRELRDLQLRSVGVVGLSVGHSIAFAVAQEGLVGRLKLADPDTLELTNLNRLPSSVVDWGCHKAHIAARRILEMDPYLPVQINTQGITEGNIDRFLAGLDAVIEVCDSIDIKFLVRHGASRAGVPVIMDTSDRGLFDVERFDLHPERPPFHGLVGNADLNVMKGLSTAQKMPYALAIVEPSKMSPEMAASMIEINQTAKSWPQLASDIAIGAGLVASAIRRLFTGKGLPSGRGRLDLRQFLDSLEEPQKPQTPKVTIEEPLVHRPALPDDFENAVFQAASLAPSVGNRQPWRFVLENNTFMVHAEMEEKVGMDINFRGTAVSCGAALANATIVAAKHHRMSLPSGTVKIEGGDSTNRLVVSVSLGNQTNLELADLAAEVTRRATNRQIGSSAPLSVAVVDKLSRVTGGAGARLVYVPSSKLSSVTEAWAEADRIRFLDEHLHLQMMEGIRRPGVDSLEKGVDERSLELTPTEVGKYSILRRSDVVEVLNRADLGARLADGTRTRMGGCAGMVAVVMPGTERKDYAQGGFAFQHMWLMATKLGLGLHPMVPVFGYANHESELVALVGTQRAAHLFQLRNETRQLFGVLPHESIVVTARIHDGPSPTAISHRVKK